MKIVILSSKDNWIYSKIDNLIIKLKNNKHQVNKVNHYQKIKKCDILFIIGYHNIVPNKYINLSKVPLVLHESKLPKGRGWSPMTWEILKKKKIIYFTLFRANKKVDSGEIYLQKIIKLTGVELYDEIKKIQYNMTEKIFIEFISKYPKILKEGKLQKGKASYYKKRFPINSRVIFNNKISEIFDLLRVSSYLDYPVYFIHKGKKFKLKLENYEEK